MHICLILNSSNELNAPLSLHRTLFNQIPIKSNAFHLFTRGNVQGLRLSTLQHPPTTIRHPNPRHRLVYQKSRPIIEIAATEAIEKARRLFARHRVAPAARSSRGAFPQSQHINGLTSPHRQRSRVSCPEPHPPPSTPPHQLRAETPLAPPKQNPLAGCHFTRWQGGGGASFQ